MILKRFVGNCSNFEGNSLTNGKPMQVFESRGDMMVTSYRMNDDTGYLNGHFVHFFTGILNFLEWIKGHCRKIVI